MMNTPGAHRERTPRPAARCKHTRLSRKVVCSCRGPSACKQGRRIYNTLLLQAMALYIHGPLRCKNLLGRISNPRICTRWMQAIRAKRGQDPLHQALTSFVVLIFFTRGYAAHRLTGQTDQSAYRCDTDTALFPSGSKPAANLVECGIPGGEYSCLSSCGLCFEVEVLPG